nr:polyprotein [Rodent hepacivirus]
MVTKKKAIVAARRRPGPQRSKSVPKSREKGSNQPRKPAPTGQTRQRPKAKRQSHKKEGWLHWWNRKTMSNPIPIVDPVLSWTAWLAAPSTRPWPNDPRHRSRNLGRIVDGVTGWAADAVGVVPVVGRVARPVVRVGAHVVRGVEDVLNAVTSPFGFGLFIITILSVLAPAAGVSHWCAETSQITNCCTQKEISFCTESLCWHAHGCVPCTADGCWTPVGVTWSVKNSSDRVDIWYHLDWVAGLVYACDVLDIGDWCSLAAVATEVIVDTLQYHHDFVCNLTCFLFTEPEASFPWFFKFVAQDITWVKVFISIVEGAPGVMVTMLTGGVSISLLVLLAYCIEGRLVRAAVLLCLLSYAHGEATVYTEPEEICDPSNQFSGTSLCFTPAPHIVREGHFLPPGTRGCIWSKDHTVLSYPKNDSTSLFNLWNPNAGMNWRWFVEALEAALTEWAAQGMPDVTTNITYRALDRFRSCYVPTKARLAGKCTGWYGNLSAGETWEDCGKGAWLTKCAVVWSSLVNSSWPRWPTWYRGLRFPIAVDPSPACAALNWTLRLPGYPEIYSFNLAYRPLYHHYSTGEAASGYLQFSSNGAYQVIAGGTVLSPFPFIHDTILLFCFSVLVRARYMPFVIAAWLIYSSEAVVIEELAGPALVAAEPRFFPFAVFLYETGWHYLFLAYLPFFLEQGLLPYIFCAVLGYFSFSSEVLAGPAVPAQISWYLFFFGLFLSIFPFSKRVRAGWLWSATYLRGRLSLAVADFLKTSWNEHIFLCFLSLFFPQATLAYCVTIATISGGLDLFLSSLEAFWVKRMTTGEVAATLLRIYDIWGTRGIFLMRWLVGAAGRRGKWLYDHLGEIDPKVRSALSGATVWLDPLMLQETEVVYVRDAARKLACGDVVDGLPVVARLGELVMCGWNSKVHMDGWRLLAPFKADVSRHTSWFRTIALAMTGRDTRQARGQVAILGTGLKSSMGFGYSGALLTTYHSSRGKTIATPAGPTLPLSINATDDTVVYPLPTGMTCLEACGCGTSELWCFDRHGGLHRGELKDKTMVLTAPVSLRDMKGASGSPIMCSQGHVVGMLKSVCHVRRVCCKVNYVSVKECTSIRTVIPDTTNSLPPPVPKDFEVRVLHAATGTGKTTKIPMGYVNEGYNVLVLNPSVVTTRSMGPYMLSEYRIAPSIHTGESSTTTGTKLTYCTYGKLTAMQTSLLEWADVVICDECHDVTAPTLLGIGHVLAKAEACGVKLVLLATATPPGCSTTKHPLITECELGTSGEIPYYGKKLELVNYQKGRHLVFFTSKELCETNAKLFASLGCTSVAYYRGKPGTVIPSQGDVVVCATDALMTGYTGDFDSVTDCNLAVETNLDLDLNPTFSLKLRTVQANAVVRMQRRGRTGRGRPGIYRYVDSGEACSGIVPESNVVEAYDMAYAWYRMLPGDTQALLETYGKTPGLPVIQSDLEMWAGFMDLIRPNPAWLEQLKLKADSFVTLTAMQWELSEKKSAPLPGSEGRWKGGRYKQGKCPLIVHMDCDTKQEWDDSDPFIQSLVAMLGLTREEPASGWALLLAGGIGIGTAVIIDATSSLVVVGGIGINQNFINTLPAEVIFDLEANEAEECGMDLMSVKEAFMPMIAQLREQANALSATLAAYASGGFQAAVEAAPSASDAVLGTLLTYMSEVIAGGSTFLGLATIRNNAPLACCHAFVAGVVSMLPLHIKCLVALAAGSVAATLTHTRPACAFVATGIIGAGIAELSMTSIFTSLFCGYAGATAGANVAYTIMEGKMPTLEDLLGLLGGAFNPGAVVAGIVVAIVLKKGVADRSPDWTNRLLAMLARTNVVPPAYFLDTDTLSQKIGKLLRDMTPIQLFHRLVSWLEAPDTVVCGDNILSSLVCGVYRILAGLVEWLKSHLPMPNFGMLSCDRPYKGEWAGNGAVVTRCGCGKKVSFRVEGGYVTPAAVPFSCWSHWMGGVPINGSTCFQGTLPAPLNWTVALVLTGWNDWYEIRRMQGTYYLTGVSKEVMEVPCKIPTEYAYVDGARVSQHCGEAPCLIRDFATINGTRLVLPISLEALAKDKRDKEDNIKREAMKRIASKQRDEVKMAVKAIHPPTNSHYLKTVVAECNDKKKTPPPLPQPKPTSPPPRPWRQTTNNSYLCQVVAACNEPPKDMPARNVADPPPRPWRRVQAAEEKKEDKTAPPKVDPQPVEKEADPPKVPIDHGQPLVKFGPPAEESVSAHTVCVPDPDLDAEVAAIMLAEKPRTVPVKETIELGLRTATTWVGITANDTKKANTESLSSVSIGGVEEPEPPPETKQGFGLYTAIMATGANILKKIGARSEPVEEPISFINPTYDPLAQDVTADSAPASLECPSIPPLEDSPDDPLLAEYDSSGWETTSSTKPMEKAKKAFKSVKKLVKKPKPTKKERLELALLSGTDSDWETQVEDCSWSYIWNGVPISTRQVGKLFTPIRYLSSGLGRMRQLVYYTSPSSAEERKAKVTYWRRGEVDSVLTSVRQKAIIAASKSKQRMMSFTEAASHTPPRSATSCLSGLTASEVRGFTPRAHKLCTQAFNSIGDPTSEYCMVTVMPKVEIFVLTREKPTHKPARLIAYPPLEMRVAEKMVLGNIAPAAVKAVLGSAYGFQYTPWERVGVLVEWWRKKKRPMGFACDTICFDSTITAEDVAFETAVYSAAASGELAKQKVHGLGSTLYTSSPMYNQDGKLLGVRNCRASGVFTTSSSNCLTAYTKAVAAAYHAGLEGTNWLVHGDDIICICEATNPDTDANKLNTFRVWMAKYGAPQGDVITPCYSLEEISACSSNVSMARDLLTDKPYYYLTRDPTIPLGRAMAETFDRNVAQTWVGNIILHYPAIWASRVLMVHWLDQIDTLADEPTDLIIDIWGTEYTISVWHMPHLIEKLHGPAARRCAYYTPAEVTRVSNALKHLGYPNLRVWKQRAKALRVRLLKRGGSFAYLAKQFLWFSVGKLPPDLNPTILQSLDFKLPSFSSPEGYLRQQTTKFKFKVDILTLLSVFCFVSFVLMAH